jgi:hypothetical protein
MRDDAYFLLLLLPEQKNGILERTPLQTAVISLSGASPFQAWEA